MIDCVKFGKKYHQVEEIQFEKDVDGDSGGNDGNDDKISNAQRLLTMISFTFLIPDQFYINWFDPD